MINLRWTEPALSDLYEIEDYLGDEAGIVIALRTIEALHGAATALCRFPDRGRPGRVSGTREFVVTPYVIAYRTKGDTLQILRVLHGARRWPSRL